MNPLNEWSQHWGGVRWRVTPEGVEVQGHGIQRTPGEPVTMRRIVGRWKAQVQAACLISGVPAELVLMTIATEGALVARSDSISYPPLRLEPKYVSDEETPHQVSFGPMHVLLSTYRSVMRKPHATREEAMKLGHNILAGALYIRDGLRITEGDPILVAAKYNAGSLVRADDPASRFYSRWHIRAYGNHLDRAARWFGDACAVVREAELTPSMWPEAKLVTRTPNPMP